MENVELVALVERLRGQEEDEHVEFKAAKTKYGTDETLRYCSALANEGGGYLVLGVQDKPPRTVSGSAAFLGPLLTRLKKTLREKLRTITVVIHEVDHPGGRVVVLHVPAHPPGEPVTHDGRAWERYGEELISISGAKLSVIARTRIEDFSAEICRGATIKDLDPVGIAYLRSKREEVRPSVGRKPSDKTFLQGLRLMAGEGVTYAGLILLGQEDAVVRHMANAEVIYEFRQEPMAIDYDERFARTAGYLTYHDDLWARIDSHTQAEYRQDGAFRRPSGRSFEERIFREAILNAVAHRDYGYRGSIFIHHTPTQLTVTSPGSLVPPVTLDTILDRSEPRNRRIADVLESIALVQRSGQGMDVMFQGTISAGKGRPDFADTDPYQVSVALPGHVRDQTFVEFIKAADQHSLLSEDERTKDLLVLDLVRSGDDVPRHLHGRLRALTKAKLVEVKKRGRRPEYILARAYWELVDKPARYTAQRGLDRAHKKELLLQHLKHAPAPMTELVQVLPDDDPKFVRYLMQELRKEGRARPARVGRGAPWSLVPSA